MNSTNRALRSRRGGRSVAGLPRPLAGAAARLVSPLARGATLRRNAQRFAPDPPRAVQRSE